MKDGFIPVASGVPKIRTADCRWNAEQVFTMMRAAEKAGAAVLVLPELCLTGAACGDLFLQDALLQGAEDALATVLEATRNLKVVAAVGLPLRLSNRLYDCAAVIQSGRLLGVVAKSQLESGQERWFSPAPDNVERLAMSGGAAVPFGAGLLFPCRELPEVTLGFEMGADLESPLPPSVIMAMAGATVIGCLAADTQVVGRDAWRRQVAAVQSGRLSCGYVCAGAGEGESTTDGVYGAFQLLAEDGVCLSERRFDGGLLVSEFDVKRLSRERRRTGFPWSNPGDSRFADPFSLPVRRTKLTRYIPPLPFVPEDGDTCRDILTTAALALKHRLEVTGAKCAVIGLSGGLDSTLAVLITGMALQMLDRPMSDITAVTMPCFGTTDRTKNNAVELAGRMGASLRTVDLSASVRQHFRDIGHDPEVRNAAYENAQARERTQVLMDIANDLGGLVIGTGDLSELALGWCTYNGDHMSMYAVNAGIPKTLVRRLVAHMAETTEDDGLREVLRDVLDTPISPELLPAVRGETEQRTEDLVGPYELHDFFLYYMLRWGFGPKKIYRLAVHAHGRTYSHKVIAHWLQVFCRRFFSQQFKRNCVPDGPAVGSVGLSPRGGWAMPSDASAALWLAEAEEL